MNSDGQKNMTKKSQAPSPPLQSLLDLNRPDIHLVIGVTILNARKSFIGLQTNPALTTHWIMVFGDLLNLQRFEIADWLSASISDS